MNTQVEHKALYRKYRPDDFTSLVGQDHVRTTLENAIAKGTVSHAYLLTGPRGTGKTSTAKLFAKAINCENPDGCNPCGKCYSCSNGTTDIIEIDAASNNSVDDIRQLKENIILAPMSSKYKVYILDEVHMLTQQAFNAMLKIVEEPPAHAIFVLATTEVHKIPATILSRCQRFDFRRISNNEIVERLKYVLIQEGRTVEDTALNLIAQVSAGGMRDALSLLDQALSGKNDLTKTVTLADILDLTGAVDVRVIGQLISLISNNDVEAALSHFNKCFESGKEPKFFIEEMMIYLRDILVYKKLGPKATLKKANTDENFSKIASTVQEEKIYMYLNELQETLSNSKFHHDIQLLMEMTIIRLVHGEKASLQVQIDELRKMLMNNQQSVASNIICEQVEQANEFDSVKEVKAVHEEKNNQQSISSNENKNQSALDDFQTSEVSLPGFGKEILPSQYSDEDEIYEINDPVGFIQMAQESEKNGTDWTKQVPSEIESRLPLEPVQHIGDNHNPDWNMPTLTDELVPPEPPEDLYEPLTQMIEEDSTENEITNVNNIILSEKENSVLEILKTSTIDQRENLMKVRESIINEIGSLNISTKRVFGEFIPKAVNDNTVILVHVNKIQVKLIEKPVHNNNISQAFDNVYKKMDYIAITQEEWVTVVKAYKYKRSIGEI